MKTNYKQKNFICPWCSSSSPGFENEVLYKEHKETLHGDFGANDRLNKKIEEKKTTEKEKPQVELNGFGARRGQCYRPCNSNVVVVKTGNLNFAPVEEHNLDEEDGLGKYKWTSKPYSLEYEILCQNCNHKIHVYGSPTTRRKTLSNHCLLLCPICSRDNSKKAKEAKRKNSIMRFKTMNKRW